MSVTVTLGSVDYTIPSTGETDWGSAVTAYLLALGEEVESGSGASALTVKNEGVTLSSAVTSIDFVGGGVNATGTTAVTVTIPTVTTISGNAGTATALQTPRTINGEAFDGTANITITDSTKVTANGAITGATKTKITYDTKGLVTAGADATTADIADSSNKRYVTDAQLTVIGNTSGTNTGDQTTVSGNAGTATTLQTARNINGVSFNGSANIETGWSFARRPASPHADDEEFTGTAFSGWTQGGSVQATAIDPYGNFSTATQWRHSWNSMRPDWLMFQMAADGAVAHIIHKPVTVGTNKLVWARLGWNSRYSASPAGNDHSIGIRLSASSGGAPDTANNVTIFLNETDANEYAVQWSMDIAGVSTAVEQVLTVGQERVSFQYVAMQKISSVFHFWVAPEAGNWIYLNSLTYTGSALDRVSLIASNGATTAPGCMIMGADFIRFYDGADKLP